MLPPAEGFQPRPFSANRHFPDSLDKSRKILSKFSLLSSSINKRSDSGLTSHTYNAAILTIEMLSWRAVGEARKVQEMRQLCGLWETASWGEKVQKRRVDALVCLS